VNFNDFSGLPLVFDHVGSFLGDHVDGGDGMSRGDGGHNGGVHDPQAGHAAAHPQLGVHNGAGVAAVPHLARARLSTKPTLENEKTVF